MAQSGLGQSSLLLWFLLSYKKPSFDSKSFKEQICWKMPEILQSITNEQKITESTETKLKQIILDFLEIFLNQKS